MQSTDYKYVLITMYAPHNGFLDRQQWICQKLAWLLHLPEMNGWFNACDTVMRLSGSKINIFSNRSLNCATVLGSSSHVRELVKSNPISFDFMFTIILFTICSTISKINLQPIYKHHLSLSLNASYISVCQLAIDQSVQLPSWWLGPLQLHKNCSPGRNAHLQRLPAHIHIANVLVD